MYIRKGGYRFGFLKLKNVIERFWVLDLFDFYVCFSNSNLVNIIWYYVVVYLKLSFI